MKKTIARTGLCLFPILLLLSQTGLAKTYQCTQNGKKTYQDRPCQPSSNLNTPQNTPAKKLTAKPVSPKPCASTGREMSVNLDGVDIRTLFQIIADFSHHTLDIDPNITGSGSFHYDCRPWDAILRETAAKYKLMVHIDQKTIKIRKQ